MRRGNYLVTVNAADDDLVDTATDIMERCGSIDIDERATQWQQEGWQRGTLAGTTGASVTSRDTLRTDTGLGTDPTLATGAAGAVAGAALTGTAAGRAEAGEVTRIPVIEEELRVGKREVRRGGIRVYTRVIDKPVEETVHLREEHANVERRPVDRPATEADLRAMKEGTIEVRETSEEAVVSKQARVVEEVEVGKTVTDREEKVRDTVRRTDVQVEETDKDRTLADTDRTITDRTLVDEDRTITDVDVTKPKDLGRP
ncbi:MAG: YsnF/AvaK domain-containing protein [Gammaproteobacteria bacterium]